MSDQDKRNDYDDEPIFYCANCLSLSIIHEDSIDSDCCKDCGGTNIKEAMPDEWEKMYRRKYGKDYVTKDRDPKKSAIFKLSLGKLMAKVSDSPKWESIIKEIYSHFPKGISKADSIVLFFDKLSKDNKLDALRLLLYKMKL